MREPRHAAVVCPAHVCRVIPVTCDLDPITWVVILDLQLQGDHKSKITSARRAELTRMPSAGQGTPGLGGPVGAQLAVRGLRFALLGHRADRRQLGRDGRA